MKILITRSIHSEWSQKAQVNAGDIEGSRKTFKKAITEAEKIENPSRRAYALGLVAEILVKVSDVEGARETFQKAITEAEKIGDSDLKDLTLRVIEEMQKEIFQKVVD